MGNQKNIKDGTRLYINLTNKCNTNCPFCCMYSGEDKGRFITFEQFKNIIEKCETDFELQLEGGEPLLHKDIFLFIEYAIHTERCKKLIILTNGYLLDKYIHKFIDIANWYNIKTEIKVSVNYWLLNELKNQGIDQLYKLNTLIFATEYIENIDIILNVRKRLQGDDWIDAELEKYGLTERANIFNLQSYGKLKDSEEYGKPIIIQNIQNWSIYASDGTCFGQDLILRSEYEK